MCKMKKYNYNGNQVRVLIDDNGEPVFVAKDVCEVLGYNDYLKTIAKLDGDEKDFVVTNLNGNGRQAVPVINEAGIYAMAIKGYQKSANAFLKWITRHVLTTLNLADEDPVEDIDVVDKQSFDTPNIEQTVAPEKENSDILSVGFVKHDDNNLSYEYEGNHIRVVIDEQGNPMFVAKDVCDVLEHTNSRKALSRLDDDEKGVTTVYTLGGKQELSIVYEAGLYSLILTSRKPEAKQFKRWITHEVLPSIRKTGQYEHGKVPNDIYFANALVVANNMMQGFKKQLFAAEKKIEVDAPKVDFYDRAISEDGLYSFSDAAKMLGYKKIGRTTLMRVLRNMRILMVTNEPFQTYVNKGYFRRRKSGWYINKNDEKITTHSTKLTIKGIDFVNRLITGMTKHDFVSRCRNVNVTELLNRSSSVGYQIDLYDK